MFLVLIVTIASASGVLADQVCYSGQRLGPRSVMAKIVDCNDTQANISLSFGSITEVSISEILARMSHTNPAVTSAEPENVTGTTTATTDDSLTAHLSHTQPLVTSKEAEDVTGTTTATTDDSLTAHMSHTQPPVTSKEPEDVTGTTTATTDDGLIAGATCPPNMVPGNCTCQRSCAGPDTCTNSNCHVTGSCVCPSGFLMNGTDCIPRSECGCFVADETVNGTVLQEGDVYRNPECTREYRCHNEEISLQKYVALCADNAVCAEPGSTMQCHCSGNFTGNGNICLPSANVSNCQDVYTSGIHDSGIYTVKPTDWPDAAFDVYCNMTDDGGWTVFQRRVDGTVDFYRDWASYKSGFGNMMNEFWLGNDKLHYLTNQGIIYKMHIDIVNANGAPYYAEYSYFHISNEADNYRLSLGSFFGSADYDALSYHRGQQFTTKDRDNDLKSSSNCAVQYHGAWWYNICHNSNLNGGYHNSGDTGLRWLGLPGDHYNIKYTEMKIRPA